MIKVRDYALAKKGDGRGIRWGNGNGRGYGGFRGRRRGRNYGDGVGNGAGRGFVYGNGNGLGVGTGFGDARGRGRGRGWGDGDGDGRGVGNEGAMFAKRQNWSSVKKEIADTFFLTDDEMHAVCDGSYKRLLDLHEISTEWKQAGFKLGKKELFTEVLDGYSVFHLLCNDHLDRHSIIFSGSRLNIQKF